MTYAEALAIRSAIEDAILAGAGIAQVTIGDRSISYRAESFKSMLSMLNRDINSYENRSRNKNPNVQRVKWTRK